MTIYFRFPQNGPSKAVCGIFLFLMQRYKIFMTLAIKSLDLFELICDYPYIGVVDNFKQKPGVIQSHLFETTVLGDVSWIVIREYDDGRFILHSLSDRDRIKTGIRKE